ncbi:MAG TPA: trehalose-6-phosphate synthase [Longimicrobiales bacterium]|nr:trehalose-6-phosphate synthase [Longimicrobiales bacterium]
MARAAVGPAVAGGLDADSLGPVFRQAFPERRFVVVSNREPYEHYWDDAAEEVAVRRPAGGLVAALDPLMQAVGGIWTAWGSGDRDAEVVDDRQRVRVPPETESYTLHRLWLSQQDIHQYYYGYANQFLWPLCHLRPALTRTRARYWERYVAVNRRFAEAVIDEVDGSDAAVWFQDYHLALAPQFVRRQRPDLTLAHFWHIPFPPLEIFRVAGHGEELLRGLLANDVVGFHLPLFCDNFLRCTESLVEGVVVDWDRRVAELDGHTTYVRAFPISIDVEAFRRAARQPGAEERIKRLRARYAPEGALLGLGVDRIDYSKGLEEKLKALDLLFDLHPEFRERFTYVQVAVPSRTGIDSYDWLNEKLERAVWAINDRYGTDAWRPVHLVKESLPLERLALLYRTADVCVVNSLQDGMNLVAKEFIAAQVDEPGGVLMLSRFAGAAEELDGAYEINPYDPESSAEGLREVLLMSAEERADRLRRLRGSLRTIYDWMGEIFQVWGAVAREEEVPLSAADGWKRTR